MSDVPSQPRIVVVPGRRSGRAVVRGTRVAESELLSMLALGMTGEDALADFLKLTGEDAAACLSHAATLAGMTEETGRET